MAQGTWNEKGSEILFDSCKKMSFFSRNLFLSQRDEFLETKGVPALFLKAARASGLGRFYCLLLKKFRVKPNRTSAKARDTREGWNLKGEYGYGTSWGSSHHWNNFRWNEKITDRYQDLLVENPFRQDIVQVLSSSSKFPLLPASSL